jgi:hypothetical protein
MIGKRREGARHAPLPARSSPYLHVEHKCSEAEPQDLLADSADVVETNERPSDLTIEAMVAALRLLYDPHVIAPFRLHSAEHKRLEAVRADLVEAIRRCRRNARRRRR